MPLQRSFPKTIKLTHYTNKLRYTAASECSWMRNKSMSMRYKVLALGKTVFLLVLSMTAVLWLNLHKGESVILGTFLSLLGQLGIVLQTFGLTFADKTWVHKEPRRIEMWSNFKQVGLPLEPSIMSKKIFDVVFKLSFWSWTKGRLTSCLVSSLPKKNERRQFDLRYYSRIVVKSNFFVQFLGELEIPKRHFETNWPWFDLSLYHDLLLR